jgi:solute carrier family 25 protein 44
MINSDSINLLRQNDLKNDSKVVHPKLQDPEDFGTVMLSALRRKEVSVAWRDTSLPHLLVYGSALYVVEQGLMYPSDLVKTRLQIDTRPGTKMWREMRSLFQHVVRVEGFRGLYRGFRFSTLGGIPPQLTCLVIYNWCKEKVEELGGSRCHDLGIAPLIAGAMSEGVTAAFWVPIDIVVQRLQIQGSLACKTGWEKDNSFVQRWSIPPGGRARTAVDIVKEIVREDGILGLWRGLGAHYCSFVPQTGIWWASYERSKLILSRAVPQDYSGTPVHIGAGISAGAITAVLTNPLDIVKVRIQTQVAVERTAWLTLGRMLRTEGLTSLGKGLAPKLWMSVPVSAVSSVCYELIMSLSMARKCCQ